MIILTEEQAGEMVKDKTVAVVGNAKSILTYKNGHSIDAHEVIIRFNSGIPMESALFKTMGKRTDILAGFKFNRRQWELAGKPPIWYRGWYNTYQKPAKHRQWPGVQEWRAAKHREDVIAPYLVQNKGPSNGVMLLEVLVNLFEPRLIRIFGFDFFDTLSWYPESRGEFGGGKYHDGKSEEYYIKEVLGFHLDRPGVLIWERS